MPRGTASVKVDLSGLESFLDDVGHSGAVEMLVDSVARDVMAEARLSAPVKTGDYQRSIHVETVRTRHRTVAKVVADVPHALAVEARTGNLARALKRAKRR